MKRVVLIVLGLVVAACSNAAIELTAASTQPTLPPATATVVPPTPTVEPTPVPPATATVALPPPTPTVEPTPVPTANFVPADIVATWTRSDRERGDLFLILKADGTYAASHGTPEDVVHTGRYTLEGRVFTWVAEGGWGLCTENDATYLLRYTGDGQFLVFELLNDDCRDRRDAFRGFRWDRYVEP